MNIKNIAYKKYQLDWMIQHGYTLTNLINELSIIQNNYMSKSLQDCFDEFESTIGFNENIWASYEEFIDNEYQDDNYMKYLLSSHEYELYKKEN